MPDLGEMLNDPRAAAEGKVKAQALNPEHLAELCRVEKVESEDYSRDWRIKSRQHYDLWLNKVTFRDKEDWQTQLWVPKVFSAVEQGTALVQRSLQDTPEAFGVEGIDEPDKALAA